MPLPQRLVQWFAAPMLLSAGVLLPPPPIAIAQVERQPAEVILQVEGALGPDSPTLTSDGTPYAIHTFEGQAGQTVTLVMESLVLDAYLFLNGPDGQKLAENDDFDAEADNYNAVITLTLPVDGTYTVMANAYETEGGAYTLTVLPGEIAMFSEATLQQVEARQLNRQAMRLSRVGENETALGLLDQAIVLWRKAGDRRGEAISLNNVGLAHHNLSRHAEALEAYNQALVIQREIEDRYNEATSLNNIGSIYYRLGDYSKALELYQASLNLWKDMGDEHGQAFSLNSIGLVSQEQSRYAEALEYYRQALEFFKNANDTEGQAATLNNMATVYEAQGDHPQALEIYQQNLQVRREANNRSGEATDLNNIAGIYTRMNDYEQALDYYQQGLRIKQAIGDRHGIAISLNNIGNVYAALGNYPESLDYFQQALAIYVDIGDRSGEAIALSNIGSFYHNVSNYPQALNYYRQALEIQQTNGNLREEASTLGNIGSVYGSLGDYDLSIDFHEQALEIRRTLGDRNGEAISFNNLGVVYGDRGDYSRALENYQQALAIFQALGNRSGEAGIFNNIGAVYEKLTDYSQALSLYGQALAIRRDIGDRSGEATALSSIGGLYASLGSYPEALNYYQQALTIQQDIGDRQGAGASLNSMGVAYLRLKDYTLSIDYSNRALAIAEAIGNRQGIAATLANIGRAYSELGNYNQSLDYFQRSVAIVQALGDRYSEGVILSALGETYRQLGDYPQALDYHQQALAVLESLGARDRTSIALRRLGHTLADQGQTELAITFYKQSINLREGIREGIRSLDPALQQSYTDSVAEGYRELADLLLNQGRIPEAQQVLDLLQLEEVREFTNTRALWTGGSLAYSDIEQSIVEAHGDLITFGQAFYECQQTNCDQLAELSAQRTRLNEEYNAQVATFREQVRQNRSQDEDFLEPDRLGSSARNLLQAHPNSVLIYPFVTEDKLWLLWASAGAYGTIEQEISQEQLARAVQRFGELMTTGGNAAELQATSQQLYDWLVKPLEASLQANGIEKLIFVNDRVTRYIPMSALFDGEQYLLERYTISTVISPAITDTSRRLGAVDEAPVLGLGLTQPVDGFAPLPAVREELTQIVRSTDSLGIFPGSIFLDEAFTLQNLERNLLNHRVLHIATHAEFVPGRPGDSYILLGDGDRLDVNAINAREHLLENLHMVVLSACQTALGGPAGDGSEIAGISSYFLDEGRAQTVVASLWKVSDSSTSLLMQRFYELLSTGELTKAEALRQAQLSLLYNQDAETRLAAVRSEVGYVTSRDREPSTTSAQHPYHWAPFILIGNGL